MGALGDQGLISFYFLDPQKVRGHCLVTFDQSQPSFDVFPREWFKKLEAQHVEIRISGFP